MSIEERLTRALEEEADQIDVDVVRLLGVTRGRLTSKSWRYYDAGVRDARCWQPRPLR